MLNEGEVYLTFRNKADRETLEALRAALLSGKTLTLSIPARVVAHTKRPMDWSGFPGDEEIFELKVSGAVSEVSRRTDEE
jgi:hypothetical protein